MHSNDKQKDVFWDLEKLLPKRKTTLTPFTTQTVMHEYCEDVSTAPAPKDVEQRRLSLAAEGHDECDSYIPVRQRLLTRVRIRPYRGQYDFYDRFRKAALLYYDVRGTQCSFVPFYSYMPQYEQMNREQKDYYFYWRDEVRVGRYIKTDYSYVYLYAYEIINLPEKISHEDGLRQLMLLWKTYRRTLRGLDRYFSVWIQDYCLLYRLTPPTELLEDCYAELIAASSFKEFYLFDLDTMTNAGLQSLLFYFSDYDYRASRYYSEESRDAFERHIYGALGPLMSRILREEEIGHAPTALLVRDAFPSSLCTHKVKCRLEIEYHPLARAEGLRLLVSAAVKYTENRLRAVLGVKSRLSVKGLPDVYKQYVDRYFDELFLKQKRELERRSIPDYEQKYDAPREHLSSRGADDIEKLSWDTTLRLVGDEEAEELLHGASVSSPTVELPQDKDVDEQDGEVGLSKDAITFLRTLAAEEIPPEDSLTQDALADAVNEAFSSTLGDIVLERTDDGYRIIEDYREDVDAWLLKRQM